MDARSPSSGRETRGAGASRRPGPEHSSESAPRSQAGGTRGALGLQFPGPGTARDGTRGPEGGGRARPPRAALQTCFGLLGPPGVVAHARGAAAGWRGSAGRRRGRGVSSGGSAALKERAERLPGPGGRRPSERARGHAHLICITPARPPICMPPTDGHAHRRPRGPAHLHAARPLPRRPRPLPPRQPAGRPSGRADAENCGRQAGRTLLQAGKTPVPVRGRGSRVPATANGQASPACLRG